MNLTINDAEIKQAISDYVGNQGISVAGKTITVELTIGRKKGDNPAEAKAEISIVDEEDAPLTNIHALDHESEEVVSEPGEEKTDTSLFKS